MAGAAGAGPAPTPDFPSPIPRGTTRSPASDGVSALLALKQAIPGQSRNTCADALPNRSHRSAEQSVVRAGDSDYIYENLS